jgi:hypothetical protein
MDKTTITKLLLDSDPLHGEGDTFRVLATVRQTVLLWPRTFAYKVLTIVFTTRDIWKVPAFTTVVQTSGYQIQMKQ